jgi:hypothetical protein
VDNAPLGLGQHPVKARQDRFDVVGETARRRLGSKTQGGGDPGGLAPGLPCHVDQPAIGHAQGSGRFVALAPAQAMQPLDEVAGTPGMRLKGSLAEIDSRTQHRLGTPHEAAQHAYAVIQQAAVAGGGRPHRLSRN